MNSSFLPGMHILFIGHGDCLIWYNFCMSWGIANLVFLPQVQVQVLAHPRATLQYLADKAWLIFCFRPCVLIVHLDLDPLALADLFWHALGLLVACISTTVISTYTSEKVILVHQSHTPRQPVPYPAYSEHLDAFYLGLILRAHRSSFFSFVCA